MLGMSFFAIIACNSDQAEDASVIITEEDKEELRHLKKVLWPQAYSEQDTVLLDKILAEEFQFIEASGNVSNKQFELNWIKENKFSHDSFYYDIKRFDFFENGTAIVSGTGHIHNDSTKSIYQSSNVFIRRNDEWKAIASHVSGVKEVD